MPKRKGNSPQSSRKRRRSTTGLAVNWTKMGEVVRVLKLVKNFCTEIILYCSPDGMFIENMDVAHVALIKVLFNHDTDEIDYSCDKNYALGLNIATVVDALDGYAPSSNLNFVYDPEKNPDRIFLRIHEDLNSKDYDTFELTLLNLEEDQRVISTEITTIITVPLNKWELTIKKIQRLSDGAASILIERRRQDPGMVRVSVSISGTEGSYRSKKTFKCQEDGDGAYPIDIVVSAKYLAQATSVRFGDEIEILLTAERDHPVAVRQTCDAAQVTIWIALKIKDD